MDGWMYFQKSSVFLTSKLNFNGGQFYEDMSNFGYFKKWEKVRLQLEKSRTFGTKL